MLAGDLARRRAHRTHAALLDDDAFDLDALGEARAVASRAGREGDRQIGRVEATVARHPQPADEAARLDDRQLLADLARRHEFDLDAACTGARGHLAQLREAPGVAV